MNSAGVQFKWELIQTKKSLLDFTKDPAPADQTET